MNDEAEPVEEPTSDQEREAKRLAALAESRQVYLEALAQQSPPRRRLIPVRPRDQES